MIIWIMYWIALLALSTLAVYLCVIRLSHGELDVYNRELKQRLDQAELAYLRGKKTQSRIKFPRDL